jgi:hypothetical protein
VGGGFAPDVCPWWGGEGKWGDGGGGGHGGWHVSVRVIRL